ncbi:MAG: 50S ribosomal protein L15 [Bacteroidales bacterium]|nr:50S ribosomal protein L15 [Bacteroidales bacterium]MBQ5582081.1 50S ribosomal protein L15 [Bacteroidales bacterium]
MKLNNLKPAVGSTHTSKRLGRGQGSGKGGTSTRGTKGAQARAGYEHKIGFEGGQMPIQRRLPKFGFKNPTRVEYKAVNVAELEALAAQGVTEITVAEIKAAGLAGKNDLVKVLGNGDIKTAVTVTVDAFSKSAIAKIEAAGGKAVVNE